MSKTLEPRVKLPLGNPVGYVLYNFDLRAEAQSQDNVKWVFAVFGRSPNEVHEMKRQILYGLGSALNATSPLRAPLRIFKSRDIYFDSFYAFTDRGIEKDAPWKYKDARFVRDESLKIIMDELEAERYARRITRRR